MKMTAKLLKWKRGLKSGAIMKPSTFQGIEASAAKSGLSAESAKKVAGSAYWRTAQAKFRGTGK